MRIVLTAAAVMVALVFIVVSAAMNFAFVSSLGKTPLEGQMFGAVSLASDAFKALLPLLLARAVRNRQPLQMAVGALMFVLFTGASFLSAVGFSAVNRMAVARAADTDAEALAANRREVGAIEARIAALPAHRPLSIVAEAMAGAQQDRRWALSKKCTNATDARSREFCAAYLQLRVEHATGVEAVRLGDQRATLLAGTTVMADTGAGRDADPQASVVASVMATDKGTVQRLLVLMIAVIVEIGSGFGLYVALGLGREQKLAGGDQEAATVTTPAIAAVPSNVEIVQRIEPARPNSLIDGAEPKSGYDAEIDKAARRDPEVMRAILRRPSSKH